MRHMVQALWGYCAHMQTSQTAQSCCDKLIRLDAYVAFLHLSMWLVKYWASVSSPNHEQDCLFITYRH